MPSTSPAQARLMRAVAHGWKTPGGGGPSVSVAKDFTEADKAKGVPMKKGGPKMKASSPKLPKALAAAAAQMPPPNAMAGPAADGPPPAPGMKKGGMAKKKFASGGKVTRGDGIASRGHTKGRWI